MDENRYMAALTQGVYVLGVKSGEKINFMTAAWITQVSGNPKKLLVAVSRSHYTAEMIRQAGKFAVNVLAEGQEETAKRFGSSSGRNTDKAAGTSYRMMDGMPVLDDMAAYMTCTLSDEVEDGDHVLFIGTVTGGKNYGKAPLKYDESVYFG